MDDDDPPPEPAPAPSAPVTRSSTRHKKSKKDETHHDAAPADEAFVPTRRRSKHAVVEESTPVTALFAASSSSTTTTASTAAAVRKSSQADVQEFDLGGSADSTQLRVQRMSMTDGDRGESSTDAARTTEAFGLQYGERALWALQQGTSSLLFATAQLSANELAYFKVSRKKTGLLGGKFPDYFLHFDNSTKGNPVILCARRVFQLKRVKYVIAGHIFELNSKEQ